MEKRDIIVIGSSAGGVMALQELVAALPADFAASIFIVQHVAPYSPTLLPQILTNRGLLPAGHPEDGERIRAGHIYIAPPNQHMLIEDGYILIKNGPKENRFRPSIDALFRSAAFNYGARTMGVILTGMLNDGTSGMWSIKRMGGLVIVQKPEEAQFPDMPLSVLEYVEADHIVSLSEIPGLLVQLVQETAPDLRTVLPKELERMKVEVETAAQKSPFENGILDIGEFSPFTCPECKGTLIQFREGNLYRYRCHTGHSFSPASLTGTLRESLENKLWEALKILEEMVLLFEQNAAFFKKNGDPQVAESFTIKAENSLKNVEKLRNFIFKQ